MADWITPKQFDEMREAFHWFNEATDRATEAVREFGQNASDACGDDWEESARRRTDDNLRDAFG